MQIKTNFYESYIENHNTIICLAYPRGFNVSFIDNICNHRCKMCVIGQKETFNAPKIKMSEDVFAKVCEIIPDDPDMVFDCSPMGEPLMFKKTIPYLRHYREKHPKTQISMSTNARFLSEDSARQLFELGLDNLYTSHFSCNENDYIRLTGAKIEDYEIVRSNIVRACAIRDEVNASTIISTYAFLFNDSDNQDMEEFVAFYSSHVDNVFKRRIRNIRGYYIKRNELVTENQFGVPRYPCHAIFSTANIRADGSVFPCYQAPLDKSFSMGNIMDERMEDIWKGEKFKQIRAEHLAGHFDTELCRHCEAWDAYPPVFRKTDKGFEIGYPGDEVWGNYQESLEKWSQ